MTLEDYREQLDAVDKALEENFVRRMRIVDEIGAYKRANGLPTLDAGREAKVLEKHASAAEDELKPYMRDFFRALMNISKSYQDSKRAVSGVCAECDKTK